ncbi:FMN-dependent oxidoreductase (nitrilotriacetate monooxygenase family) [Microbacterium natoriense]|uniref:FMN-dependent oxidoreductase (Nitrilotriacetate monooxygenase family) n=1 Tax=Microbacterium natoriense TaxID=284570 RepID=A0AAW8F4H8_9MICO|nr:NtaA/DmoA family FMN-dependent monooxygenase [Microbacterium natoriense]MDQ0649366.1 FMN-dependent oxidoreductase (nitrilotriacetate monooxygenase family) [Microbacterium natoriense]
MTTRSRKQIILAAYVGGVNEHTLWEHPDAGSQIDFSTFRHVAQTAERGRFDYFFLAEGLALRARAGRIFEHDIAGRPDTLPVLAALAAVTSHIGLVGTLNATFNEPYELARQIASLDHLSGGRAGWNVVTSFDAFTGANFRRGGFLPHSERYVRAEETVATIRRLWDSWAEDAIVADKASGEFLADADAGAFVQTSSQFDIAGRFTVPRSPQGRPVIVQAGVSPQGRDFAASTADAIFSPYATLAEGKAFYADIKERAARFGRGPEEIKILPAAGFVLGDSQTDAEEKARHIREQQLTDKTIQVTFEQVWNRDLSAYDPDGPLPDIDPDPEAAPIIQGRAFVFQDRFETVRKWRELADERGLTLRGLAHEVSGKAAYVGTAAQIADQLDAFVQEDGGDGVVIGSHIVPAGLDEFVDQVVPLLQERGSLRTDYESTTLRDNLGLPVPARDAELAGIEAVR